jgi:hypothetical protein
MMFKDDPFLFDNLTGQTLTVSLSCLWNLTHLLICLGE